MIVTVRPIIEPETMPAAPLSRVMNERLKRLASELQDIHLKGLLSIEPRFEDVVIYISYNSKYSIRWKIVNDVSVEVETKIADQCAHLGYIPWKAISLYNHLKAEE